MSLGGKWSGNDGTSPAARDGEGVTRRTEGGEEDRRWLAGKIM